MSFRTEIKARLSKSDLLIIKSKLLALGMKELYPSRQINSLYFDTPDLMMFHDSEEGVLPRKKIRLRWYEDKTKCSLEKKISSIEGRFKTTSIKKFNSKKKKFIFDQSYGLIKPSLLVSYRRSYFIYKELRITFDTSISYVHNFYKHKQLKEDFENVMEIKTDINANIEYIHRLIPNFQAARFSKYCRGLELFINNPTL